MKRLLFCGIVTAASWSGVTLAQSTLPSPDSTQQMQLDQQALQIQNLQTKVDTHNLDEESRNSNAALNAEIDRQKARDNAAAQSTTATMTAINAQDVAELQTQVRALSRRVDDLRAAQDNPRPDDVSPIQIILTSVAASGLLVAGVSALMRLRRRG